MTTARPAIRVFNVLFDDRFGGPSKRVTLVAEQARKSGVETTMILPEGTGNAEGIARAAGLQVQRLDFQRIPRPSEPIEVARWVMKLPRDVGRFFRLYRRGRPDAVHVNGGFFVAPAWAARLAGIPLVWHLNDVIVPKALAPLVGAQVRAMAREVVVSSRAVAHHYGVPLSKSTVLYPPVDTELIRPRETAAATPPKEPVLRIGLIANWTAIKGVDLFVRAAARVHAELGDRLQVVLAGARLDNHEDYGRLVDSLLDESGLRPVTADLGFQADVARVLDQLDIVVLASTTEAVGAVVLEGMAAGLPVVATDVGGVKEVLVREPGQAAGVLVPASDPEAMAEQILRLSRDPDRRRRMGRAGRRNAESHFSIDAVTSQHLDLYHRTVAGRPARKGEEA